jgi:pimeloyl-ACP methyl ester carboxylesterase
LVGTLSYMSPEQARGLPIDARSDVFSLGVVLYEMLAGQLPFTGPTPIDVLVALLDREPAPLHTHAPALPPELERIVQRSLRKARDERTPSAQLMHDALREVLRDLDHPAPSVPHTSGSAPELAIPQVCYARSGDVNIAYQVIGDAPLDLVFVMGWISHLEYFWSEPSFARFLRRLASFARVILFDKRGTGLSDRVPTHQLPTLEQRMDDVRAVMDAVGSARAVLCGVSEGGPMCSLFAATYPEKTIALVMIGSYARRLAGDGYPWGPTLAERELFFAEIRTHWGGPVGLAERAPSKAHDPHFREWWSAYLRHGASPNAALALTKMNTEIDIRKVLPSVRVPTLVLHRTGDTCLRVEEGRYLAEHIPGARFVELPGVDHLPFVGDQDAILAAVEEFLTGMRPAPEFDRVLATVLIAQLAGYGSGITEPMRADADARYCALVHKELQAFKGRAIAVSAPRVLATFDGPARAIRAACTLADGAKRAGVHLQIGLHTGECDVVGDQVRGLAVDIASSVAARARTGEVLVSSTVRDLVAGAGIRFADRGTEVIKGQLGELRVFAVERGAAS